MLCMGVAYDQLENCQTVHERGAGVRVAIDGSESHTADALAAALSQLLSPASPYAAVAAFWGRVARTAGGLHRAVEVVERTAELGSAFLADPSHPAVDGAHEDRPPVVPPQPRLTFFQRTFADAAAVLVGFCALVCYAIFRGCAMCLRGGCRSWRGGVGRVGEAPRSAATRTQVVPATGRRASSSRHTGGLRERRRGAPPSSAASARAAAASPTR